MESENGCTEERQEPELKGLEDENEEEGGWEGEMLRTKISNHPLYSLLVETHLNCLKVGGIDATDLIKQQDNKIRCFNPLNQSELDRFMETYCFALSKLKEAMEESQLKSMAFINSMHWQLRDLTGTGAAATAKKPTTSSSNDTN
ncbi:homeobox protein knotted-1-like 2 [Benincasa hispida]|uniref:homeobox protein knotted-1-like 2 n=1 Tax=Benincasa hispida TaxID=102211 RepID=UPI001901EA3D|nr:homeobox protein knotted-1-like 2 [Benincasa hispida]